MSLQNPSEESADRNVEIWKIKKLIKSLQAARGYLKICCTFISAFISLELYLQRILEIVLFQSLITPSNYCVNSMRITFSCKYAFSPYATGLFMYPMKT